MIFVKGTCASVHGCASECVEPRRMIAPDIVRFSTRTPRGFHDLLADAGPQREIEGLLFLPPDVPHERLPLVITAIGSRGMKSGREVLYAQALTAAGMAVLIVDSYGPRGFAETVSDQGVFPWAGSLGDALYAFRAMLDDPRFDPQRIAMLGYSRGGSASVLACDERMQTAIVGTARFAAHVALYPPCYIRWATPTPTNAPLLMLLGGRDNLAPASQGRAYADILRAAGARVEICEFPEAAHSFDADGPVRADTVQHNLSARDILIEADGTLFETTTGIRDAGDWAGFLKRLEAAPGTVYGGASGAGPLPREVAVAPIRAFLQTALGM
jgi:dienelactone hydrolase